MFSRFFQWLFRKRRALPAPSIDVQKATIEAPQTHTEFEPYVKAAPAIETEFEAAPADALPQPPIDESKLPAEVPPRAELPQPSPTAAPSSLVPATLPRAAPSPAYSDELMRTRALYFAPVAYAATPSVERVLAPDLLFRLAPDPRRAIAGASAVTGSSALPAVFQSPAPPNPQPRLMDDFSTSTETKPRSDSSGCVLNVDPLLLTLFFRDREGGPSVPPETTTEYLTNTALLEQAIELRDRMIQHWSAGGAPLTARQFFALALEIAPHPGTALLLCHNTAKAFSRGSDTIVWRVVNRARAEYSDGESTHVAAVLHRNGVLKSGPFANPSMFFLLFSASEFGTADPGDFNRFFASASAVWFAASSETRLPSVPPSDAARQVAQTLVDISRQMAGRTGDLTPAHRGWLWANAMNFAEFADFSRSQSAAHAGATAALRGACVGLREADQALDPAWRWHVPRIGASIRAPLDLTGATAELLSPQTICI